MSTSTTGNINNNNQKNISVDATKLTVDNLNARIGINSDFFTKSSMGYPRKCLKNAIKAGKTSNDDEVKQWAAWLSEPNRLEALLMPEMTSEVCRREMKLDRNAKKSASSAKDIDTKEEDDNVECIDDKNKRIIIGDKKRMDNMSHLIDSGQTRKVGEEEYKIFWVQESYRGDSIRQFFSAKEDYHTWTNEMKRIHEELLQDESGEPDYTDLDEAIKKKYFKRSSEETKKKAEAFRNSVKTNTQEWINKAVQNRFFRLTSLMGQDFFKKQGNTIQFVRDDISSKGNYDNGGVKRAITDSEWAHAQRMGYTGAGGHVHRVKQIDRFKLS